MLLAELALKMQASEMTQAQVQAHFEQYHRQLAEAQQADMARHHEEASHSILDFKLLQHETKTLLAANRAIFRNYAERKAPQKGRHHALKRHIAG